MTSPMQVAATARGGKMKQSSGLITASFRNKVIEKTYL
jgi:hypothetical protein